MLSAVTKYLTAVCSRLEAAVVTSCSAGDGANVLGVGTRLASSQAVVDVAVRNQRRPDWLHHQLSRR